MPRLAEHSANLEDYSGPARDSEPDVPGPATRTADRFPICTESDDVRATEQRATMRYSPIGGNWHARVVDQIRINRAARNLILVTARGRRT